MTDDGIGDMASQPDQDFAPGDGMWHPGGPGGPDAMGLGGAYDADSTTYVHLAPMYPQQPVRPGEDPLAAPGHRFSQPSLGGFPDEAEKDPFTARAWQPDEPPAAGALEPAPRAAGTPEPVRAPDDGDASSQWTIPFVADDVADESGEYSVGVRMAAPVLDTAPPGLPADDVAEDPAEDLHSEHPTASYVLRVNCVDRPVTDAWIGESLLYVLRERLGLAGAKDGCEQGECGACSVRVDGRLIASCLTPAATAAGCEIRTVEGLGRDGQPSDVQSALAASSAVQCGFCLPGMAMTIHDLLEGNPNPTELETRQALSGNLCRCSGYRGVLDAVCEVVAAREVAEPAAARASGDAGGDRPDADAAPLPHQSLGQALGQADGGTA